MNIIRAWKDKEYRRSLSDEELSLLPDNPAGPMELSDDQLEIIVGGDGGHDSSNHGGNSNNLINVTSCAGGSCIGIG